MSKNYENFDLILSWHEPAANNELGRVSIKYKDIQSAPTPYFKRDPNDALSILMSTNIKGMMIKSQLVAAGQQVANLLLPGGDDDESSIRTAFRDFWRQQQQAKKGVRLRLFYPNAASDSGVSALDQQIQLLAIPWEYIYLPETDHTNSPDEKHFLSRNRDISIVHSFKSAAKLDSPDETDRQKPMRVAELLVDLAYLSWLGDNPANQNQDLDLAMFKDFADELDDLNTIVDTSFINSTPTNFKTRQPPTGNAVAVGGVEDAEPDDVVQALLDNDLVHLVFHSEPSKIYLKNGLSAQLTEAELLGVFDDYQDTLNARAVLLIGCNSGDGGRSIGAALHRVNVPLVVSFTASIKPSDAQNFVDGFYRAFAAHPNQDLEQAVTNGRRLMFKKSDDDLKWFAGFATPRVYLNRSDSVLVPQSLLFGSEKMKASFDEQIDRLLPKKILPGKEPPDSNLNMIMAWVKRREKASFFVTGRAGNGKSTLIAKVIDQVKAERRNHVIYHFCRRNATSLPGHPADPLAFIRYSLAPQLDKSFGEYRNSTPPGRFPLLVGNATQALRDFVLGPLGKINDPPLIVIDDIDVFPDGQGFENSILKLLRDQWGDLVNVARFLITADVTNARARTELEMLLGEPDLRLVPEQVQADVAQNELGPAAKENVITLSPQKGGDYFRPLPLVYEIANRFGSSFEFGRKIPLEVAASPQGVKALYQAAIATITQTEKYPLGQKGQELLDVVATAYEPLFPSDVAALIGANEDEMAKLLDQYTPFFMNPGPGEPLILFHNSLRAYLQRDIVGRARLAAIHDQFVAAAWPGLDWAKMEDWVTLTGTTWGQCFEAKDQRHLSKRAYRESPPATVAGRYIRRYLALHAYEAYRTSGPADKKRQERADHFLNLVCDPAFRTVRFIEIGADVALQDIQDGLRVVYSQYALPSGHSNNRVAKAIDRLLAANKPEAGERLMNLERQLRLDNAGVPALFKFLGLDPNLWQGPHSN